MTFDALEIEWAMPMRTTDGISCIEIEGCSVILVDPCTMLSSRVASLDFSSFYGKGSAVTMIVEAIE